MLKRKPHVENKPFYTDRVRFMAQRKHVHVPSPLPIEIWVRILNLCDWKTVLTLTRTSRFWLQCIIQYCTVFCESLPLYCKQSLLSIYCDKPEQLTRMDANKCIERIEAHFYRVRIARRYLHTDKLRILTLINVKGIQTLRTLPNLEQLNIQGTPWYTIQRMPKLCVLSLKIFRCNLDLNKYPALTHLKLLDTTSNVLLHVTKQTCLQNIDIDNSGVSMMIDPDVVLNTFSAVRMNIHIGISDAPVGWKTICIPKTLVCTCVLECIFCTITLNASYVPSTQTEHVYLGGTSIWPDNTPHRLFIQPKNYNYGDLGDYVQAPDRAPDRALRKASM